MRADDGTKVKIKCRNSGCTVRQKKPGQKWATIEKGDGGVENFKVLEQKYKTKGFK